MARDVVDLDSPYVLDVGAAQWFEADGFIRLSGVLSPATIAHYEPEITAKVRAGHHASADGGALNLQQGDRSCTGWVPLQDTPAEMGPLEFATVSQAEAAA